ncbi:MAG: hypothetical protein ACKVJK_03045 [Methylophagaceae bacterium]|jgi:hypothetical protein|tara:strand:+ start:3174 stop:4250 length:1077 start_codon:yes stop_codon:yes gene_type:complete
MMNEDNVKKLIDFTLEVTNGCQFSCTGCTVDMEGNSWPTDGDWNKISYLIDDFDKNEFRPMNLQIGPTDLMTSINRDQILTSVKIKNLATKFLKTAINCAFLDPKLENYVDFGKKLNWLLKGGLVKFVIPFEAYHIDNEGYVNKIKERIQLTLDNMPDVTHTKTYLIINYETSSIYDREFNKNLTEELIVKTHHSPLMEGFDCGLVLPHGRTNLRLEMNRLSFFNATMKLKDYMVSARQKYKDKVDVYDLLPQEGKDFDVVYKAGKLYMTPFVMDAFLSFEDEFLVKKEWTFDGLYEDYLEGFLSQTEWALTNPVCKNCQMLPICAERGVHSLMQIMETTECISPAKELEHEMFWKSG